MEHDGTYAPPFGRCVIKAGNSNGYKHCCLYNPRTYYLIKQEFFGIDNGHAIVKNSFIRKNATERCPGSIAFEENCSLSRLIVGHARGVCREMIYGISPAWMALRFDASATGKELTTESQI
jgi:hypothetical protein